MQLEAAKRRWSLIHSDDTSGEYHDGSFLRWAKKPSVDFPFHRDDGVTIWVSKEDLTPDDDFLNQAQPERPS